MESRFKFVAKVLGQDMCSLERSFRCPPAESHSANNICLSDSGLIFCFSNCQTLRKAAPPRHLEADGTHKAYSQALPFINRLDLTCAQQCFSEGFRLIADVALNESCDSSAKATRVAEKRILEKKFGSKLVVFRGLQAQKGTNRGISAGVNCFFKANLWLPSGHPRACQRPQICRL